MDQRTTIARRKLPSPKGIALAVMEACRREETGVAEVAKLIQLDPALSGRLIALSNSASQGARSIVSATDAVARMGLLVVRNIALGFSLIDQYSKGECSGFDYKQFWCASLFTGIVMSELCKASKLGAPEEMYSLGLLAKIGELALATEHPDRYAEVLAKELDSAAQLEEERRTLQVTHVDASVELLNQWGLPPPFLLAVKALATSMTANLSPDPRVSKIVHALHLAVSMAEHFVRPRSKSARATDFIVQASSLGIEGEEFQGLTQRALEAWRNQAQAFDLPTDGALSYEEYVKLTATPDMAPGTEWFRVMVVEDEAIIRGLLVGWLRNTCHYTVVEAPDGRAALAKAMEFRPHVVLTDWLMPEMDGLELCRALRSTDWGEQIYVLMLTSVESENELVQAFDGGVDDYITKPVNLRGLSARLTAAKRFVRMREAWQRETEQLAKTASELAITVRKLETAAYFDSLTGLSNRRAGSQTLAQAMSAAARHKSSLSLISLDIDKFKLINDQSGHAAGDAVLQRLAELLRESARTEDTVCRWGGEEFLLICPGIEASEGARLAERIRSKIAASNARYQTTEIRFTVSIGVTDLRLETQTSDRFLKQADDALYCAKVHGRNRVAVYSSQGCTLMPLLSE